MKKKHLLSKALLVMALLIVLPVIPTPITHTATRIQTDWGQMPLYFIANQGQMDERVSYYVQGVDKTLYFTPDGVTFALTSAESRWNLKLDFVNANFVRPIGKIQSETIVSYFRGSIDEWHTSIPTFSEIVYRNLWEGIDLVYSGTANRLKYEFIVLPGADPTNIQLVYRGAAVRINNDGRLEISTPAGSFWDETPIAYQEVDGRRLPVAVSYSLGYNGKYGFQLGTYDPVLPLVIDPAVLVHCGYIGGGDDEEGRGIAVDSAGNIYVTGITASTETTFPKTVGPDLSYNGDYKDAFVAKVKADGTGLVYAGYIGGSGYDVAWRIAVDAAGNAYVVGSTDSTEATFPVTVGPDLTYNGGNHDTFVAKVKADGTGLVYAGYIGGSGFDYGYGITVDMAGNAYISGSTNSTQATFPVSMGPDLTYNGGTQDAYVAKVKADGTGLVYAGYIGGSGHNEYGESIAVDLSGNAYVTGYTDSTQATFPVTVGPDLSYNGGNLDAYVAKVKADGTGLLYCGYIGGNDDWDTASDIVVDAAGSAYVTGGTYSTETSFPVTVGPDLTFNGGTSDAYVAKVRSDGTGLDYCGYIGGNADWELGRGVALDADGSLYVTGYTNSAEDTFPVTVGPDLTFNGSDDVFVAKVDTSGTSLVYCGYIGGSGEDKGYDIATDSKGNAYITGITRSTEDTFPVTVGPDLTYNGGSFTGDAFVAKVLLFAPTTPLYLPLLMRH